MSTDTENIISAQGILTFLPKPLKDEMSKRLIIYDTLESTNKTAKELAAQGAEHGTVIIANHQSAGKGRRGKTFFSPANHGIYISFILDAKNVNLKNPTLITASAAVSVCEAIEFFCDKSLKLKWVNDIFSNGGKICGILTESVIGAQSHTAQCLILGIGINFSTPPSGFPDELEQIAGSLFETQAPPITRNCLIAELIARIVYPKTAYTEDEILEYYNQRLLPQSRRIDLCKPEEES